MAWKNQTVAQIIFLTPHPLFHPVHPVHPVKKSVLQLHRSGLGAQVGSLA
jgi:hypothetical protein